MNSLRKAAERNHPAAQCAVGMGFLRFVSGRAGLTKNLVEARK